MLGKAVAALTAGLLACVGAVVVAPPAAQAVGPTHTVAVSGTGVEMYPSFSSSVTRYAVTTTDSTGGSVTVAATTSDPAGTILVDGQPLSGGQTTVTGLNEGDEISVIFKDSGGTEVHSLVYLPSGFPYLQTNVSSPGLAQVNVALTLNTWAGGPIFEAIVDRNGVPSYVRTASGPTVDLKRARNGLLSVVRTVNGTSSVVTMNDAYQDQASYQIKDAGPTDGHDSILLKNGHRVLLSYADNADTGNTDAVIQEQNAAGGVVFQWDSSALVSESVAAKPATGSYDYAHINSVQIVHGGDDFLASFRNLSAVLLIARHAHDGYRPGDIVWKFGGKDSDFNFPDDPYGGPCAQHTAYMQPNGHLVIFDNGSGNAAPFPPLCPNPSDRSGDPVGRGFTRVTEYALTPPSGNSSGSASLVWQWHPSDNRFGFFAGSAQRLANGNTLVGWAGGVRQAVADEVSPSQQVLWELQDRAAAQNATHWYTTYRAMPVVNPDVISPDVRVSGPTSGATYDFGQVVAADYSCTDRGGSNLRTCKGPVLSGSNLDTSTAGPHIFKVTATDGAGNSRTVTRHYTVTPQFQADETIRALPGGSVVGEGVRNDLGAQTIKQKISADGARVESEVKVTSTGTSADRFRVGGTTGSSRFRVRYFDGATDVTDRVVAGTLRTPSLAQGQTFTLRMAVKRLNPAGPGDNRTFKVSARPVHDTTMGDTVAALVRATS